MTVYYWFWAILIFSTLLWYSTVTVYVAFKGLTDIRQMLEKLGAGKPERSLTESEDAKPLK